MKQEKRFCRECEEIKPIGEFTPPFSKKIRYIYCRTCRGLVARRPPTQTFEDRRIMENTPRQCSECLHIFSAEFFRHSASICSSCFWERVKVRNMTVLALAQGIIERKKKCQECGEAALEMHHPDYSQPLWVIWLCKTCHRRTHVNLKRQRQGKVAIPFEYF